MYPTKPQPGEETPRGVTFARRQFTAQAGQSTLYIRAGGVPVAAVFRVIAQGRLLAQAPHAQVQATVERHIAGVRVLGMTGAAADVVLVGAVVDEPDGVARVQVLRRHIAARHLQHQALRHADVEAQLSEIEMAAGAFDRVPEQRALAVGGVGDRRGQHARAFQQRPWQARLHIALRHGDKLHRHALDKTVIEVQVDRVVAGINGVDGVKARQGAAAKHHVVVELVVVAGAG